MGICNSCNYGVKHICPEQNVYRTVCSFKDPNREAKAKTKKEDDHMKIIRKKDVAICDDYKAGITIDELAAKYKVHRTTITNILKRCDVPIKNTRAYVPHVKAGSISEETVNAVMKEFEKGTHDNDISNRFGLTMYRVYKLKKAWRMKKNEVKPVTEEVPAMETKIENKHYIYHSGKTKPASMFAPAELNDELVWAAEIKTLDDIFDIAKNTGTSSLEIKDGNIFISAPITISNDGITINPVFESYAMNCSQNRALVTAAEDNKL